jgi:hypothetical protein
MKEARSVNMLSMYHRKAVAVMSLPLVWLAVSAMAGT